MSIVYIEFLNSRKVL